MQSNPLTSKKLLNPSSLPSSESKYSLRCKAQETLNNDEEIEAINTNTSQTKLNNFKDPQKNSPTGVEAVSGPSFCLPFSKDPQQLNSFSVPLLKSSNSVDENSVDENSVNESSSFCIDKTILGTLAICILGNAIGTGCLGTSSGLNNSKDFGILFCGFLTSLSINAYAPIKLNLEEIKPDSVKGLICNIMCLIPGAGLTYIGLQKNSQYLPEFIYGSIALTFICKTIIDKCRTGYLNIPHNLIIFFSHIVSLFTALMFTTETIKSEFKLSLMGLCFITNTTLYAESFKSVLNPPDTPEQPDSLRISIKIIIGMISLLVSLVSQTAYILTHSKDLKAIPYADNLDQTWFIILAILGRTNIASFKVNQFFTTLLSHIGPQCLKRPSSNPVIIATRGWTIKLFILASLLSFPAYLIVTATMALGSQEALTDLLNKTSSSADSIAPNNSHASSLLNEILDPALVICLISNAFFAIRGFKPLFDILTNFCNKRQTQDSDMNNAQPGILSNV